MMQLILTLSLFVAIIFTFTGCETEEDCTQPAGITMNIPNNQFFCFKTGALTGNCGFAVTACCSDFLFAPNNFFGATSVSSSGVKGNSTIASAGAFSKLCDIKSIPTAGYVASMAADYDIGYVVKLADGTHARFVVLDFGTTTTGGVSYVQIAYEYPFN